MLRVAQVGGRPPGRCSARSCCCSAARPPTASTTSTACCRCVVSLLAEAARAGAAERELEGLDFESLPRERQRLHRAGDRPPRDRDHGRLGAGHLPARAAGRDDGWLSRPRRGALPVSQARYSPSWKSSGSPSPASSSSTRPVAITWSPPSWTSRSSQASQISAPVDHRGRPAPRSRPRPTSRDGGPWCRSAAPASAWSAAEHVDPEPAARARPRPACASRGRGRRASAAARARARRRRWPSRPAGPAGPGAVTTVTPVGKRAIAARRVPARSGLASGSRLALTRSESMMPPACGAAPILPTRSLAAVAAAAAAALVLAACGTEGISVPTGRSRPTRRGAVLRALLGLPHADAGGDPGLGQPGAPQPGPEPRPARSRATTTSSSRSATAASRARSCPRTSSPATRPTSVAEFVAKYAGSEAERPPQPGTEVRLRSRRARRRPGRATDARPAAHPRGPGPGPGGAGAPRRRRGARRAARASTHRRRELLPEVEERRAAAEPRLRRDRRGEARGRATPSPLIAEMREVARRAEGARGRAGRGRGEARRARRDRCPTCPIPRRPTATPRTTR